jgi:hypothetical protein
MTLVADFSSGVQWTTIRCSTIPRHMPVLPTGITFHCLSLAVSCKVIWPGALITCGWARSTSKAAARLESAETASPYTSTTTSSRDGTRTCGIWAGACEMAWLIAVVATATSTSSAKSQSRAVRLNMAKALAMITLLRFCGSW